jgi:hypothetical protein
MHTVPLLQSPSTEHSCAETGHPSPVSCAHIPNGQSENLRHVGRPGGAGVAPGQTPGMPASTSVLEPAAPPVTGRIPPLPPTLPAPPAPAFPEPPAPPRATPPAPPAVGVPPVAPLLPPVEPAAPPAAAPDAPADEREDPAAPVLLPPHATKALARVTSIHESLRGFTRGRRRAAWARRE